MKWTVLALLASAATAYAVDGTIFNATGGKPQPNATVSLIRITQTGPQLVDSTTSGPDGKFNIAVPPDGGAPGPKLLQASYKGVVYNKMIPPGTPDSNVRVDVYESSNQPGPAQVTTHMLLLEPANGQLTVSESYVYTNNGKIAYSDPKRGTLQIYLPPETGGKVDVSVTAPNSVAIRSTASKTAQANVYKIDFPVKPGESRIDLTYQLPFTPPGKFVSRVLFRDPDTKVLAPPGVTVSGPGLRALGTEPQTQATIYNVNGPDLNVSIAGSGVLARSSGNTTDTASGDDSGAGIAELFPQLYGKVSPADGLPAAAGAVKWILLLLIAMLSLGFAYQYRRPNPRPRAPARNATAHDAGD